MVNLVISFKQKVWDLLGLAVGITQDPDENQKRKRELAKKFIHDGLRAKGFDVDRALLKEKPKKKVVSPDESPKETEAEVAGAGTGESIQEAETTQDGDQTTEGPAKEEPKEEETEELKEENNETPTIQGPR